jgi:hypothetical protein
MSGWDRRRSSGEIINATLLEIFLALVFIIFALAVFQRRRTLQAEELLRSAPNPSTVLVLRDSLVGARAVAAARSESLSRTRSRLDSVLFASRYAPDCETGVTPAELFVITLAGDGRLIVRATRSRFDFPIQQEAAVDYVAFDERFAEVRRYSETHGCRFVARIQDTPQTTKVGYKGLMAKISSVLRPRDTFRQ